MRVCALLVGECEYIYMLDGGWCMKLGKFCAQKMKLLCDVHTFWLANTCSLLGLSILVKLKGIHSWFLHHFYFSNVPYNLVSLSCHCMQQFICRASHIVLAGTVIILTALYWTGTEFVPYWDSTHTWHTISSMSFGLPATCFFFCENIILCSF